jgi:hypothetical protein
MDSSREQLEDPESSQVKEAMNIHALWIRNK